MSGAGGEVLSCLLSFSGAKIPEWFELEGTLEMWFQTPCHGQGHFPQTRWITGVVCALQAAWLKPKKVNIPSPRAAEDEITPQKCSGIVLSSAAATASPALGCRDNGNEIPMS